MEGLNTMLPSLTSLRSQASWGGLLNPDTPFSLGKMSHSQTSYRTAKLLGIWAHQQEGVECKADVSAINPL